ncbi:hypothetical protein [Pseudobacillus wudalianchiensis]|nr:hypothetical protein [Bacillus wudalianchiensis]
MAGVKDKLTLANFIDKNQFDLNRYLAYLICKKAVDQCSLQKDAG